MAFKKAVKKKMLGRLALCGPTGSGKTYSALRIGAGMLPEGGTMAVIDSERRSASKYADKFDFDVTELENHSPREYVREIKAAAAAGYSVLVIDSLSHAWIGKDGALEQVDQIAKRTQSHNSFAAWRDVTPQHNELVDAILNFPGHVIATMRSKMAYVMEKDGGTKTNIRKVGMEPVQREGIEYEFDVVGDMNLDNSLVITKTRCPGFKGLIQHEPGEEFGKAFLEWLNAGKDPVAYANEGAAKCTTVEQLSALRREMEENGLFTGEAREILLKRHRELTEWANPVAQEKPLAETLPLRPEVTAAPNMPLHVEMWMRDAEACTSIASFIALERDYHDAPEIHRSATCKRILTEKGKALDVEGYV